MLLPLRRVLLRAPRFAGAPVRFASSSSPSSDSSPAVCVVGAGPAGFYVCQHLLSKGPPGLRVDLLERLPVPFGLVRREKQVILTTFLRHLLYTVYDELDISSQKTIFRTGPKK